MNDDTKKINELFAIFNLINQTLKKNSTVVLPGNNGTRQQVHPHRRLTHNYLNDKLKAALKNMYVMKSNTTSTSHKFLSGNNPNLLNNSTAI